MKSILSSILDPKNRSLILAIAAVLFMCLWFNECSSRKNAEAAAKLAGQLATQNLKAKDDSMHAALNKAGQIEDVKEAFVTKIDSLKAYNKSLYDETKKELGQVRAIITGNTIVNGPQVTVSDSLTKYADGETYGLKFSTTHIDSGLVWKLAGTSTFKLINNAITPGNTSITEDQLKIGMVLGFTETANGYEVFARSASKDVSFTQLNGALIIPKKPDIICPPAPAPKRWGLGPVVGVGFGGSTLAPIVFVGFGLQYNLIRF